jgi:hypothetical protein
MKNININEAGFCLTKIKRQNEWYARGGDHGWALGCENCSLERRRCTPEPTEAHKARDNTTLTSQQGQVGTGTKVIDRTNGNEVKIDRR